MTASDDLVQAMLDTAEAYKNRPWKPDPVIDPEKVRALVARIEAGETIIMRDYADCWVVPP